MNGFMTRPNGNANGFTRSTLSAAEYEELRRLKLENLRLKAENAELAARTRYALRGGRIALQARDDALRLFSDLQMGQDVSRLDMARRHGMTRRRWEWARAALMAARLTDGYYRIHEGLDARTVERALDALVDRVQLDGLHALKMRLPNCRQRELA